MASISRFFPIVGKQIAYAGAIFAVATVLLSGATSAQATPATEKYIQENIDKGYVILNNASLSDNDRRQQFRSFMLALTDVKRIGRFTLGQYANGASPADIDAFTKAFTDYAVAIYESRLGKYRGQTLKVTGSVDRSADDSVVNADVVNPKTPNAQPIKAAFRVRPDGSNHSIVTDMQVEGVWLAISQRSDFTGFLQQHGGSIPALTQHLVEQVQQVRSAPAAGGAD